jgi:SNF2 family DNA or RNA helicase
VFLVEPNFTVASELQAVARINRVGQTRETYSHRYIMEGTIEEQIIIDRHGKSVFGSGAKQDADSNWLLSMLENELNRA